MQAVENVNGLATRVVFSALATNSVLATTRNNNATATSPRGELVIGDDRGVVDGESKPEANQRFMKQKDKCWYLPVRTSTRKRSVKGRRRHH
jgi:hypothetical protein